MPNIIEQQDLLKGLPDNRLAMLMQKPTGDIPPFLVAAEAQRRQAIREQFSGGPQESVVDTLTKQLANVPQNIEAPAQTPPQMPPPQMAGVAALQGPQGMRHGGFVQRYQDGGGVQPWWKIPDISGYFPSVADKLGQSVRGLYEFATTPYSEMKAAEGAPSTSVDSLSANPSAGNIPPDLGRMDGVGLPDVKIVPGRFSDSLNPPPAQKPNPTIPRNETAGQEDTSAENQYAAQEAALRKRQEELYGNTEISDWEKAQKWFAAAQAAIEPGQTDMQAVINALSALGGGMATEKAAEREAMTNKEKAMLEWDIARYNADRAARAEAAAQNLDFTRDIEKLRIQDELASKRERILSPATAISGYTEQIKSLNSQLEDPTLDDETKSAIRQQVDSLRLAIATIMKNSGYGVGSVPTMDEMRRLAAGQ